MDIWYAVKKYPAPVFPETFLCYGSFLARISSRLQYPTMLRDAYDGRQKAHELLVLMERCSFSRRDIAFLHDITGSRTTGRR